MSENLGLFFYIWTHCAFQMYNSDTPWTEAVPQAEFHNVAVTERQTFLRQRACARRQCVRGFTLAAWRN